MWKKWKKFANPALSILVCMLKFYSTDACIISFWILYSFGSIFWIHVFQWLNIPIDFCLSVYIFSVFSPVCIWVNGVEFDLRFSSDGLLSNKEKRVRWH